MALTSQHPCATLRRHCPVHNCKKKVPSEREEFYLNQLCTRKENRTQNHCQSDSYRLGCRQNFCQPNTNQAILYTNGWIWNIRLFSSKRSRTRRSAGIDRRRQSPSAEDRSALRISLEGAPCPSEITWNRKNGSCKRCLCNGKTSVNFKCSI